MSDNPQAFPCLDSSSGGLLMRDPGMTLRDYFASYAPEPPTRWWGGGMVDCAGYAKWNYQYADAMLAERRKSREADRAFKEAGL